MVERKIAISTKDLNLWYGTFQALFDVSLDVRHGKVTSMIGPSGCGKSTFLRCVNRINERLGYVRTTGIIDVLGANIFAEDVELLQVRRKEGMVFQRPNPLPLSIRDNVLFGHRTWPERHLFADKCLCRHRFGPRSEDPRIRRLTDQSTSGADWA